MKLIMFWRLHIEIWSFIHEFTYFRSSFKHAIEDLRKMITIECESRYFNNVHKNVFSHAHIYYIVKDAFTVQQDPYLRPNQKHFSLDGSTQKWYVNEFKIVNKQGVNLWLTILQKQDCKENEQLARAQIKSRLSSDRKRICCNMPSTFNKLFCLQQSTLAVWPNG